MMLPPFRIRNLNGQARHGVIQITAPQYDSTLKSHPDAALRYLDEDDGETITVGSGLELSQRLEDPVPLYQAAITCEDQDDENAITHDIHTFEIERKSHTIATWTDHEAYSSKALRKSSSSICSPQRIDTGHIDLTTLTVPASHADGEDAAAAEHHTELDMYEEMQDKEVQPSLAASTQPPSDAQTSTVLPTSEHHSSSNDVEKIVTDAVEGIASSLDAHLDTLADFLQNTAKALRFVAEKTRESDTSAVGNVLSGFNTIFGEVSKLAQDVLAPINLSELAPNAYPAELDLQNSSPAVPTKQSSNADPDKATKESELSASVEVVSDCADLPSPVIGSSPQPALPVGIPSAQIREASSFNPCSTELTARIPSSKLDELYHIPSKSFIQNQPHEVPADKDQVYATLEQGGFNPDSERKWKHALLPNNEQAEKLKKRVDFALPKPISAIRPRETAKSSSETFSRSILDLEASDPDFSARFPPLMSVRRGRVTKLPRMRSRSPESRMRSKQDALTRYPSLQQLESRTQDTDRQNLNKPKSVVDEKPQQEAKPVSHMHRAWFDNVGAKPTLPPKGVFTRQSDEVEEVIAAVGRDITEASNEVRRLPGAWPDVQHDSKKQQLPISGESSGAFFNRMTGQDSKLESKERGGSNFPPGPTLPRFTYPLGRAKSMAALRPSATLSKPFDPLVPAFIGHTEAEMGEQFKVPSHPDDNHPLDTPRDHDRTDSSNGISTNAQDNRLGRDGVRRSLTEKMPHRRPYSHRYSGAGRLPWENFEDRSFDLRSGSFVQRQERTRRATEKPAPPPPPPGPAPVRQNPSHPITLPSDIHKRVNDYRTGLRHRASAPSVGIAKQSKINNCIRQLKDMGFGSEDTNEASRLSIYAAVTGGNIVEAVEMIEEDRKAADSFKGETKVSGPESGPGGWL